MAVTVNGCALFLCALEHLFRLSHDDIAILHAGGKSAQSQNPLAGETPSILPSIPSSEMFFPHAQPASALIALHWKTWSFRRTAVQVLLTDNICGFCATLCVQKRHCLAACCKLMLVNFQQSSGTTASCAYQLTKDSSCQICLARGSFSPVGCRCSGKLADGNEL